MNRLSRHHNVSILVAFLLLWSALGLSSLVACSTEPFFQKETVTQEAIGQPDEAGGADVNATTEATANEPVVVGESEQESQPVDASVPEAPEGDAAASEPVAPDTASSPESSSPPEAQPDTNNPFQGVPMVEGCPIFPKSSPWNTDISKAPVDPNSAKIIAKIGANDSVRADFGTVYKGAPIGIPFVVVGANQKKVPVKFLYADESDPGPYPIPNNAPIEGGANGTGDRHVLVLQKSVCKLYELFNAFPRQGFWDAGSGAIFDLRSDKLRPDTWTSADAAGLPIFPGLVRYEEVKAGEIRHALRFTVTKTQRAFVHPATHWASSATDTLLPPMGMRVRLKASFNITGFPRNVQVILRALKKYGMFVSDNGGNWFISGAPNMKWDDDELRNVLKVKGKDLEVVRMGKVYRPADFGRP
ncbi:MAG: hypothetical protein EP343_17360 [Deltaproteobacteria bacterium]|nr:MAG: hypothetical protein EP343_17360 [Deltaproteobacteria bacterium]